MAPFSQHHARRYSLPLLHLERLRILTRPTELRLTELMQLWELIRDIPGAHSVILNLEGDAKTPFAYDIEHEEGRPPRHG